MADCFPWPSHGTIRIKEHLETTDEAQNYIPEVSLLCRLPCATQQDGVQPRGCKVESAAFASKVQGCPWLMLLGSNGTAWLPITILEQVSDLWLTEMTSENPVTGQSELPGFWINWPLQWERLRAEPSTEFRPSTVIKPNRSLQVTRLTFYQLLSQDYRWFRPELKALLEEVLTCL